MNDGKLLMVHYTFCAACHQLVRGIAIVETYFNYRMACGSVFIIAKISFSLQAKSVTNAIRQTRLTQECLCNNHSFETSSLVLDNMLQKCNFKNNHKANQYKISSLITKNKSVFSRLVSTEWIYDKIIYCWAVRSYINRSKAMLQQWEWTTMLLNEMKR